MISPHPSPFRLDLRFIAFVTCTYVAGHVLAGLWMAVRVLTVPCIGAYCPSLADNLTSAASMTLLPLIGGGIVAIVVLPIVSAVTYVMGRIGWRFACKVLPSIWALPLVSAVSIAAGSGTIVLLVILTEYGSLSDRSFVALAHMVALCGTLAAPLIAIWLLRPS